MITLIDREFTINVSLERAWQHLARVSQWPTWARHIKHIEVQPQGELGPQSSGVIHLANGLKSTFRMTEFNPYRNWKWAGPFLWLSVHYDHQFREIGLEETEVAFVVDGEGLGVGLFGRLFAAIYARNLDRAIPTLIHELEGVLPTEDPSGDAV